MLLSTDVLTILSQFCSRFVRSFIWGMVCQGLLRSGLDLVILTLPISARRYRPNSRLSTPVAYIDTVHLLISPAADYAGGRIAPKRTPKLGIQYGWEKANLGLSGKVGNKALSRTKLRYCRTDSYFSSKSSAETISLMLP